MVDIYEHDKYYQKIKKIIKQKDLIYYDSNNLIYCDYYKNLLKKFFEIYNKTFEDLFGTSEADFIKNLQSNKDLNNEGLDNEEYFYNWLYKKLIISDELNILLDIINSLDIDKYLEIIKIFKEIVLYKAIRNTIVRKFNNMTNFEYIYSFKNYKFLTNLYEISNNKDREYKIIDLSGEIKFSFDITMFKSFIEIFEYLRVYFKRFSLIIDNNKCTFIEYTHYFIEYTHFSYSFKIFYKPSAYNLLYDIDKIKNNIISIIIHENNYEPNLDEFI